MLFNTLSVADNTMAGNPWKKQKKVKSQEMSTPKLEDISDEIILKVLGCLEIKDILRFGHVSKRLRAISQDETLWERISLCGNECIPAGFLDMALQNGCKYLDLRGTKIKNNLSPETKSKLKYLAMVSEGREGRLLKSCHSLQKLQIAEINKPIVEATCHKNGKTLEALDISFQYYMQPELIQLIARHCVELKELAFEYCPVEPDENSISDYFMEDDMDDVILKGRSIGYLVDNLTTKIEKLCLSCAAITDEQVKTLVSRCNKLTVLDLSHPYGSSETKRLLTDNSITYIIEHLKPTLEELNVEGCESLSFDKLVQLRSMPHLRKINCDHMWDNRENAQSLQKELSHVEFTNSDSSCCEFRQWKNDEKRIWEIEIDCFRSIYTWNRQ